MLSPNRRVEVNLSPLAIQGVRFSENVREAPGTVVRQTSADPPTYLVEVPEDRIRAA